MENEVKIDKETKAREIKVDNLSMRQLLELDATRAAENARTGARHMSRINGNP